MPSKILKLYLSSLILFITFSSFNVANAQSIDPLGNYTSPKNRVILATVAL